jgi:hypothetical protein
MMAENPVFEETVIVHSASSIAEAMVLRGLLQSAGIASPGSENTDPFPMAEPPTSQHGSDISVPKSQADAARAIIESYLAKGGPDADVPKDAVTEV